MDLVRAPTGASDLSATFRTPPDQPFDEFSTRWVPQHKREAGDIGAGVRHHAKTCEWWPKTGGFLYQTTIEGAITNSTRVQKTVDISHFWQECSTSLRQEGVPRVHANDVFVVLGREN